MDPFSPVGDPPDSADQAWQKRLQVAVTQKPWAFICRGRNDRHNEAATAHLSWQPAIIVTSAYVPTECGRPRPQQLPFGLTLMNSRTAALASVAVPDGHTPINHSYPGSGRCSRPLATAHYPLVTQPLRVDGSIFHCQDRND